VLGSPGIDQTDLLPALAFTISFTENLQLRLAYSETVTRPAYRELGRAEIIDVAENKIYYGDPNLKMASAENFDARLEWYPRPGEILSISAFKKKIAGPIEQFSPNPGSISYRNSSDAEVLGAELEWRMGLDLISQHLRDFSLGFNATYIKSEVAISETERINRLSLFGDTSTDRPLYDQPEYLLNTDLTWESRSSGTMINTSFGVVGKRLDVAGVFGPDEYVEPAPQLDISLSQKIGRNWRLKATAKNLLNPKYETTQEFPGFDPVVVKSYSKGMTFGISLSCEF
jgi:TonB-dependent receptor